MQCIAETGIDVPVARGIRVVRKTADRQHEVIRHLGRARSVRTVHTTDVTHDVVPEHAQ